MTNLPLRGVRVLDLTRVLAGPLCTMMLGDLGAEVIKVERPGGGDDTRGWGPPFAEDGQSAYFRSVNRNKRSIALELSDDGDRALLLSLLATADVLVENFPKGSLARYGLDKDQLLAQNPRLIWCTLSGFGPASDRPGYDFVVQAEAGWMAIIGEPEGAPMKCGVALADVLAGKDAAIAILAALSGRERGTTVERALHVSLNHSATAALVNVAQNTLVSGADAGRWGNAHPNLVPYQLFQAADAPIVLAVGTDGQWLAAASALDLPEFSADPALATNAGRVMHRERIVAALASQIATRPAADWIARLEAVRVPCGRVRSVREALADVPSSPVTGVASAVGGTVRCPPPPLDADGETIRGFGWSL